MPNVAVLYDAFKDSGLLFCPLEIKGTRERAAYPLFVFTLASSLANGEQAVRPPDRREASRAGRVPQTPECERRGGLSKPGREPREPDGVGGGNH